MRRRPQDEICYSRTRLGIPRLGWLKGAAPKLSKRTGITSSWTGSCSIWVLAQMLGFGKIENDRELLAYENSLVNPNICANMDIPYHQRPAYVRSFIEEGITALLKALDLDPTPGDPPSDVEAEIPSAQDVERPCEGVTLAPFEGLPAETKLSILSLLSTTDMARVSRVSRVFHNLLSDKSNRNALAKDRIAASLSRFQDTVCEHQPVSALPFMDALEYFFRRHGLQRHDDERSQAAYFFANLRLRTGPITPALKTLILQAQCLVEDLLALHISMRLYTIPLILTPAYKRHEFVDAAQRRYSSLNLTEEALSAIYDRIVETPGGPFRSSSQNIQGIMGFVASRNASTR